MVYVCCCSSSQEQDIPGLSLAVHHYAVRSQREWNHLSTLYPSIYPPAEMALANRMDVVDPFMQERVESRREEMAQVTADKALQRCDLQAPAEGRGGGPGGAGGGRKRNNAADGSAGDKNDHLRIDKNDKQNQNDGLSVAPSSPVSGSEPVSTAPVNDQAAAKDGVAPETSFMEMVRSFFRRFFTG